MRGHTATIKRVFRLLALGVAWASGAAVAGNNEWTSMADEPAVATNAVHPHPQVSEVIYAAAVDGFYRSTDDGRTWRFSSMLEAPPQRAQSDVTLTTVTGGSSKTSQTSRSL